MPQSAMEPWEKYMKLGLNHHLFYPDSMVSARIHEETL
ncbi:MAG: hypothetical protein K0R75_2938, partial [Paenibacillaceae bacterium]|nr:hypothetical protein [Paenibacillaceae bacterium]